MQAGRWVERSRDQWNLRMEMVIFGLLRIAEIRHAFTPAPKALRFREPPSPCCPSPTSAAPLFQEYLQSFCKVPSACFTGAHSMFGRHLKITSMATACLKVPQRIWNVFGGCSQRCLGASAECLGGPSSVLQGSSQRVWWGNAWIMGIPPASSRRSSR